MIACVGETLEQREAGSTVAVVAAQTKAIAGNFLDKAIGRGKGEVKSSNFKYLTYVICIDLSVFLCDNGLMLHCGVEKND